MPNQSTHNSTMNNPLQIQYNDPGNSVYLLYQKEVYNCDHSFLQSLMDWLYSSNESPFKFIVRNKALIKINRYGIIIQKENNAFNMNDESSNWTHIHFNLKHLKEIYVDKRHKDTCVLVSKVSPNSGSNYVWKKTNPSNYQSFRSPYGLNNAFKKSYLLTIIKFKDGPSKLLQTIQLLDSILADYNKQEEPKTTNNSVKPNEFDSNSTEKFGEDLANYYNSINMKNMKNLRVRPNVQQYFNDVFIKNQQQKFLNAMCNNQCTSESNNQLQCLQQSLAASQLNAAMQAACSINQLNQQQQQCMSMNGMTQQAQSSNFSELAAGHASLRNRILAARNNKRTLSIDNRHNSPLYANYNNSSNKSLQNYQMSNTNNSNNYFSIGGGGGIYGSSNSVNFSNLSRQGSVNEIRSPNNQVLIVNRNLVPGTGYLANTGYHQQQQHAISPNHFGSGFNSYLDLNQGGNTTTNGNTCNSPQLQAPLIEQCYQKAGGGPLSPFGFTPVGGLSTNNNTSNENLSEIGYQQYRKKYMNNLSVSSTSSLRNTLDIFSMKPSMMSQAKLHHMQHHHQMQQMHQKQNASICRQSELSGSITSMNSGYSNKLTNPLTTTTTNTPAKSASVTKKSSIGKGNAKNTESNKHDDSDKSKKKRTQANENMSQSNEPSSVLVEEKNPTLEKGEDENSKSKFTNNQKTITLDFDDNEESTVTIVEEINYKEPRNNNKSGGESTTSSSYGSSNTSSSANSKRERSVDSSLRKIPAKVLLDMLKTENDAKSSAYDTSKGMELLTIQSSLGRKLAMEMDFFNKSNEASMLKDELTSLSRLKESNKVREIINSFNNFEKNNDFNAKKKYLSKYNTINISNLGKPPPPVKKFNNPNNKMRPNPETAASAAAANTSPTIIEIHDKRSGETSSSLSFHLNTSESKAEKRLMKQQANMAAFNDKNKKSTTHTNNPIVLINSSITSKNLLNTENLLSKITDSIIKSDSPSINNDINIINTKLAKIVNMLNNDGSSSSLLSGGGQLVKLKKPDNLKVLEIGQQHQNMSDLSNEGSNIQPPPVLNPTRKRTFANMVWPMDPEEEKILRSCSPYEVPEVIVQRNDSVKSILKKNNFLQQSYNNSSSPAYEQSSPNPDTAGSKKRVDFHENCCFINFFEIQDDDFVTTSS